MAHDIHHHCQIPGCTVRRRTERMTCAIQHQGLGQTGFAASVPKLFCTLELTSASSERLRELLVGERVLAAKLLPHLEDDLLAKTLRDISRRALENSAEKGNSTLFVTFGMATWPALDGGRPAEAPVLLLPITISKNEGSNSYYLSAAGSFQLNLVLLHVLED